LTPRLASYAHPDPGFISSIHRNEKSKIYLKLIIDGCISLS
jgi:hypothetical protein